MDTKLNKYKVVSLFSGCGGMDLGFIQAGFEIIWANDILKEAIETYKKNIGDHIINKNIKDVNSKDIPNNIDVIIGGFPCQGFSIANKKRSTKDERNFLYKEMIRIIEDKKPKFVVAENVKGILSLGNGKIIDMIKNDFEKIGYKLDVKLINAAEYGVPQARQRVIMIGNRMNLNNNYPQKTHYLKEGNNYNKLPALTTKDAIEDLSSLRISYNPISNNGKVITNHIAKTNVSDTFWGRKYKVNQAEICDYLKEYRNKSEWTTKKIDEHFGYKHTAGHWFRKDNKSGSIPKPEDWWELKKILKFDDKYDKVVTTLEEKEIRFEQSLRITNWDRPSDTITATGPEIHINKMRRLTVRECARLQTFPDDFVFEGSLGKMYKQIGNAVPVLLSQKIAEQIKESLNKL